MGGGGVGDVDGWWRQRLMQTKMTRVAKVKNIVMCGIVGIVKSQISRKMIIQYNVKAYLSDSAMGSRSKA